MSSAHSSKIVFDKPNRRLSSQRRANLSERRNTNTANTNVQNCRRKTSLNRRNLDRRIALKSTDWVQLTNSGIRKAQYVCANDAPRLGQFIDLAV